MIETRGIADPDTEELVRIKSAIQSASSLISNIEQLMQSSSSGQLDTPATQSVDLDGLLADIKIELSSSLSARQVTLRSRGTLGTFSIETGKLRLILMNLLSNSIEYSNIANPQRTIETSREDRSENHIATSVWDNGLGIPAHMIDDVQSLRVRAHR